MTLTLILRSGWQRTWVPWRFQLCVLLLHPFKEAQILHGSAHTRSSMRVFSLNTAALCLSAVGKVSSSVRVERTLSGRALCYHRFGGSSFVLLAIFKWVDGTCSHQIVLSVDCSKNALHSLFRTMFWTDSGSFGCCPFGKRPHPQVRSLTVIMHTAHKMAIAHRNETVSVWLALFQESKGAPVHLKNVPNCVWLVVLNLWSYVCKIICTYWI